MPPIATGADFGAADAKGPWTQARTDLEIGVLRWLLDRLFEETPRLDDDTAATLLQASDK